MCGIIGYTGAQPARDIIIGGLKKLEYRGYDSAGLALLGPSGSFKCVKAVGKVEELEARIKGQELPGTCGLGHTRWATHGGVTEANAHPHQFGKVLLAHNGIIENYLELAEAFDLRDKLKSSTDSEVAAGVIDYYYHGDAYEAIRKAIANFSGTYAFVIMFADQPGCIYAVRNVSPIVAGQGAQGSLLASDLTALAAYCREYYVLDEGEVLKLTPSGLELTDLAGRPLKMKMAMLDWDINAASKAGFPYYMEKEIMEQPEAFRKTVEPRLKDGLPDFTGDGIPDELLKGFKRISFVACGTAMHAGLIGQALLRQIARVPSEVELASEFIYNDPLVSDKTLTIAISQSGETIDTLEAVSLAKSRGAKTLAIINVRGSSIPRLSDYVFYTNAGPEIAVASTKAYTVQLAALYLITVKIALLKGTLSEEAARKFIRALLQVPDAIGRILADREKIRLLSNRILEAEDVFMLGRGIDYAAILEGSLKLKEISYIHSEAYASGELKHGTIALVTPDTPVIAVVTQDAVAAKEVSNAIETRSRGAKVILIIREDMDLEYSGRWDAVYRLPKLPDNMMIFPITVTLQLLAYYTAYNRGLDIDKPRNLAKVVTVE